MMERSSLVITIFAKAQVNANGLYCLAYISPMVRERCIRVGKENSQPCKKTQLFRIFGNDRCGQKSL